MSKEELDSAKSEMKEEIKNDLSRGYIKMNLIKIISLIGGTVSICLTIGGGILYIDRHFTTLENRVDNHEKSISELNNQKDRLWSECGTLNNNIDAKCNGLQLQINDLNDKK